MNKQDAIIWLVCNEGGAVKCPDQKMTYFYSNGELLYKEEDGTVSISNNMPEANYEIVEVECD